MEVVHLVRARHTFEGAPQNLDVDVCALPEHIDCPRTSDHELKE